MPKSKFDSSGCFDSKSTCDSQPMTYGHGETDDDSKYCANIASRCKDAKMRYDTFVDVFRPIATRYLASSARAKTPAASGAAADVPE